MEKTQLFSVRVIPIDFQVTCSKVKVKLLFSAQCLRSSNDSEILAFLLFDHDNVVFYSYLIMFLKHFFFFLLEQAPVLPRKENYPSTTWLVPKGNYM